MKRLPLFALLSLVSLACTPKDPGGDEVGDPTTDDPTTGPGDGDGDPGDGDGAPGDGDGAPGDGDGAPGDGDGTPGDGDGDGEPTGVDGCEDGDSGIDPLDDELQIDPPSLGDGEPLGGFVPDTDLPPITECDIFLQDCVPGEKCVPYASGGGSWDANKCVPVTGDQMVGEACTYGGVVEATDDCDESSACWGIDDMGMGTCAAFCTGSPIEPVCPEGSECIIANQGSIAFCVPGCNPISQDCPDGEGCFWSGSTFACTFLTQDIPLGEPCGFINDCAKGLACLDGQSVPGCAGSACCAEFCDLDCGSDACTQPGTSCTAFFEGGGAPPGGADIGVCIAQ